jgi:hypothetical protein
MDSASAEAMASLFEGSGMPVGLSGGKRSHKAQYVRWLLGKSIGKRPEARVVKDGRVHYEPPYFPVTDFKPKQLQKEVTSERFGTVPRSEFINRMLEAQEGRSTAVKRGAVQMELKRTGKRRKQMTEIAQFNAKAKRLAEEKAAKKKAKAPPAPAAPPAEPFKGMTSQQIKDELFRLMGRPERVGKKNTPAAFNTMDKIKAEVLRLRAAGQ